MYPRSPPRQQSAFRVHLIHKDQELEGLYSKYSPVLNQGQTQPMYLFSLSLSRVFRGRASNEFRSRQGLYFVQASASHATRSLAKPCL
jgi:hypothetical protein